MSLDQIINSTDNSAEIENINNQLFSAYKPKLFVGSDSAEIAYDKQFESTCLLVTQKTNLDAKRMTVLQFYNAVGHLKKQAEAEAKQVKKYKR